jgi:hypothetical protein
MQWTATNRPIMQEADLTNTTKLLRFVQAAQKFFVGTDLGESADALVGPLETFCTRIEENVETRRKVRGEDNGS